MNRKKKTKVNSPPANSPPTLAETQEKQAFVTRRMIGMHRGRTRRGRIFKFFSVATLCFALSGAAYWVLLQFKPPDESWNELIHQFAQRIMN